MIGRLAGAAVTAALVLLGCGSTDDDPANTGSGGSTNTGGSTSSGGSSGSGGTGTGGSGAGGAGGLGVACPDAPQGPIGEDWPEVFIGTTGCDDGGPGSRELPVCTFSEAFARANAAPGIVTVLDGTYRLLDVWGDDNNQVIRKGTADAYFVIRADEGAQPVLLGSRELTAGAFTQQSDGLWRADASGLDNDPKGFWTASGEQMLHEMVMKNGTRSHADASALTEPGTWTKADASGAGCPDDNAGCYIYLLPPPDMDVAAMDFEASQRSFFYAGASDYMTVRGLSIQFVQSTTIFFEGAQHILIEDNELAHVANGNDNSYAIRIWNAEGGVVRNNRVHDSRYWGGVNNSWGITFMLSGETEPVWVCNNEIWDIYWAAVGSKGGASQIQVVGNYIHDSLLGIETPNNRCHWQGCDEHDYPGGKWTIRENVFENLGRGVEIRSSTQAPDNVLSSEIYNNLFVKVGRGVTIPRSAPVPLVRNNVFAGGSSGIYFKAGSETTWPDYWLSKGFDSDYNLFDVEHAVYAYANWSGTEKGYTLDEYRTEYESEKNSFATDPKLGAAPGYVPAADSPVIGAGDPSMYPNQSSVSVGPWPLLQ